MKRIEGETANEKAGLEASSRKISLFEEVKGFEERVAQEKQGWRNVSV